MGGGLQDDQCVSMLQSSRVQVMKIIMHSDPSSEESTRLLPF